MAYTYVWQAIFRQIPARGEGKVIAVGRSFRELPWFPISSAMTWNFRISIWRCDTYWNLNFRSGFRSYEGFGGGYLFTWYSVDFSQMYKCCNSMNRSLYLLRYSVILYAIRYNLNYSKIEYEFI